MCLGVPARVKEKRGEMALVEIGGIVKEASLMLVPEVEVGDFIILHAGFAIQKLNPEEAEETLKLLNELMEKIDEAEIY